MPSDKRILKLSDWSAGMIVPVSRVDLPPNACLLAENIDLSVPKRQGFLIGDAMVGETGVDDPTPDHNAVAEDAGGLNWQWLDFGTTELLLKHVFAETTWIIRQTTGGTDLDAHPVNSGSWSTLTADFDDARRISRLGKVLYVPVTYSAEDHHIAVWSETAANYVVSGGYVEIACYQNTAAASYVHREMDDGTFARFQCIKAHVPTDVPTDAKYLPSAASAIKDADAPHREYWLWVGTSDSTPGTPYGSPWDAATANYYSPYVTLELNEDSTAYGGAHSSVIKEYSSVEANTKTGEGWFYPYNHADGGVPDDPAWDDYTGDTTLHVTGEALVAHDNSNLLTMTKSLNVYAVSLLSYNKEADPNRGYEDGRAIDNKGTSLSIITDDAAPEWESTQGVEYYAVHEFEYGGFSPPELVHSGVMESAKDYATATCFSIAADLDNWGEGVKKVHFFRVSKVNESVFGEDVWLFAIDRETSKWMRWKGYASGSIGVLLPGEVTQLTDTSTITAYCNDRASVPRGPSLTLVSGTGAADYILAGAITSAFQELAERGLVFRSKYKVGAGLYAFVDWGQDPAGETAETILGASLRDLMGKDALDLTTMEMVGTAQGRAFYTSADGDLAYYSEVGRFSIVSPLNFLSFRNTGSLVFVEEIEHYLLLFYESKVVALDTRSGVDVGWGMTFELDGVGLLNADCVERAEGAIFWMGTGGLWRWIPGGQPARLSTAIEYPEFASDMTLAKSRAWLAVDPKRDQLLAYFGDDTAYSGWGDFLLEGDSGYESRVLVYSLKQGTWTTETMRAAVNATILTADILYKPFSLDNHLLIPVASSALAIKYCVIRQAYLDFIATSPSVPHDISFPLFKRAVLETGILDLGASFADKKLKRLHATFTGDAYGGRTVLGTVLDNWIFELFTWRSHTDDMPAPWASLESLAPAYTWDVGAESGTGYDQSTYILNNLPSSPIRHAAFRLVSAGSRDDRYLANVCKTELGSIDLTFRSKAKT